MTDPAAATQESAPQSLPGWFVDPGDPARMRWWTGAEWSGKTHLPARASTFSPVSYRQSFWVAENRAALLARIILTAGFVIFVAYGVWAFQAAAGPVPIGLVVLLALSGLAGVVSLAVATVALRRSPRLGAFGLAVWAVAMSSLLIFLVASGSLGIVALIAHTGGPR